MSWREGREKRRVGEKRKRVYRNESGRKLVRWREGREKRRVGEKRKRVCRNESGRKLVRWREVGGM